MVTACRHFDNQTKSDPAFMLLAPKFRGDVEAIAESYAGRLLLDLDRRARAKHVWYEDFRKRGAEKFRHYEFDQGKHKTRDLVTKWGCISAAIVVLVLLAVGVMNGASTVIGWVR